MARITSFLIIISSLYVSALSESRADDKAITSFPADTDWGRIVARDSSIELHVKTIPGSRVISFPRLNNQMKSLYLDGKSPEESNLKFKPELTTWEVTLPKDLADTSPLIIFETLEPVELAIKPHVVNQSDDGSVTLPAHHVVTHGKLLRYEPQPHKNTMGYWANADDWAEWHLVVSQPGEFEIEVLQGCGKGQGGSTVEIELAGKKIEFTIEDTGHFQNFKPRKIGTTRIEKTGRLQLQIRTLKKAKNAVCDIRQIRLLPVKQ